MSAEALSFPLAPQRRLSLLFATAIAIGGALALASVAWGVYRGLAPDGSRDLQWSGIHLLWLGRDPTRAFLACWPDRCADTFILHQYPNYPISALMSLLPFGALPWATAKAVWAIITLAASALLYWCVRTDLAPELDRRVVAAAFLLLLISTPYRNTLSNGQESMFAMAMLAWALRQARRGQPVAAGLLLAFGWFKFTLTFPLSLVFVARREWRVVAVAATAHIVLTLAAAAWTGTDPLSGALGFLAVAKPAIDYRFGFLDVYGLTSHLALPYAAAAVTAFAIALALLLLSWRLARRDELLLLAVAGSAAMAAFYHLSYDCVIFIFPLLYALRTLAHGSVRGADRWFVPATLAAIAATWFLNRLIEGNNVGYGFGGSGYSAFYWAMIAIFYVALLAGSYRLAGRYLADGAAATVKPRGGAFSFAADARIASQPSMLP